MAKDTRVTFDSDAEQAPTKANKVRNSRSAERQLSYEDAENCVNEMSESFPALSTRAHKLMRQVSGSFNNRTIKVALLLSVILNLLMGITCGIFFGFWMSHKNDIVALAASSAQLKDTSNGYTVLESCFPCTGSDLGHDSRVKVKSKNKICCTDEKIFDADSPPFLCLSVEAFKKKFVGNTDIARPTVPCKSGSGAGESGTSQASAAAHLMLDVEMTKSKIGSHLVWIQSDSEHRTFVGDGVEYSNGEIKIRKTGKYHVYSHMTLSTNENQLDTNEKIIVHSLSWSTRGVSKDLLFSQVTLKPNEVKSTDIEGSFEFFDGDSISVYLSHPSYLKNVPPANVFGLFIL